MRRQWERSFSSCTPFLSYRSSPLPSVQTAGLPGLMNVSRSRVPGCWVARRICAGDARAEPRTVSRPPIHGNANSDIETSQSFQARRSIAAGRGRHPGRDHGDAVPCGPRPAPQTPFRRSHIRERVRVQHDGSRLCQRLLEQIASVHAEQTGPRDVRFPNHFIFTDGEITHRSEIV